MYKSKLQNLCQLRQWPLPIYASLKNGPDHNPTFSATVTVNGLPFSTTMDSIRNSKEAQNNAAKIAFENLSENVHGLIGGSSTRVDGSPTEVTSKKFIDSAHVYKNRLQSYAVKRNLPIPVYLCEREGPPYAPRFRCKVTVEGKTTEVSECYSTIKEAEHAAAKNAWESWSLDDVSQDDTILYKNLLQVYLQKKGCPVPKYETTMSGPSHKPNFVSKVNIKGQVFEGQVTLSKKQAESHVAKVAYLGLQNQEVNKAGNSELCIREQIETQPECLANTDEAPPLSSGTENSAKRLRLSSQDLFDSNSSALSSIESNNVHLQIGSTHLKTSTNETIVLRPVIPNMSSPAGTCTFSFSDKNWVAENMNSKK